MKNRKLSLLLIVLGILCISISIVMSYSHLGTKRKDKKEPESVTENSEDGTQVLDEQDGNKDTTEEQKASVAAVTTAIELERNTPVQEINSDMYEWPHDNVWFEGYKEPDMVIYLAQNKEWFDEIVATFQKYEGRDIHGVIGWDEEQQMAYYDHFLREDVLPIYDKYEQFFREGIIASIGVGEEIVSFDPMRDSSGILYYYYDENANEKTDEFLEDNSIVHVAPHWWWQEADDSY